MFKEMRRVDRQIETQQATEILKDCDYGVLSTLGKNGYAYGVPVNYVLVDDKIYFHCAVTGHKLENIEYNDKVSFCVVRNSKPLPDQFATQYESVIIFGRATEVEGNEKKHALQELVKKYSSDFLREGMDKIEREVDTTKVVKIDIEHISGKVRK